MNCSVSSVAPQAWTLAPSANRSRYAKTFQIETNGHPQGFQRENNASKVTPAEQQSNNRRRLAPAR